MFQHCSPVHYRTERALYKTSNTIHLKTSWIDESKQFLFCFKKNTHFKGYLQNVSITTGRSMLRKL